MGFDPFSMVVAIVAISVGAGVFNNYLRMKAKTQRSPEQEREMAEMKAELTKLQVRVRVLERLAVDQDRNLSAEIAKLR